MKSIVLFFAVFGALCVGYRLGSGGTDAPGEVKVYLEPGERVGVGSNNLRIDPFATGVDVSRLDHIRLPRRLPREDVHHADAPPPVADTVDYTF